MKAIKLLVLLTSLSLTACGGGSSSSSFSSSSSVDSSSSTSLECSCIEDSSVISSTISSSEQSSSSKSSRSIIEAPDKEFTISFYNPSCGTFSTEVFNERLKTYIDTSFGREFIDSINNTKCQIANDIPGKGNSVLVIGAASSTGSLEFNFKGIIKSVTLTLETYYKPFVETWNDNKVVPNVDSNSMCEITTDSSLLTALIDLKAEDEPVEKEAKVEVNGKKLTINTLNADKGRVFLKEATFVF